MQTIKIRVHDVNRSMMMIIALFALSACEMTSPSLVSTTPIEVRQSDYHEILPIKSVDDEFVQMVHQHYERFGQGLMDITVTYPAGQSVIRAQADAARVANLFKSAGVDYLKVSTLPVLAEDQVGQVMIKYKQLTAHAPRGCNPHPGETREGLAASEDGRYPDYRFGCGVDSYIAAQVVRPRDLLGSAEMDLPAGDRAAARLDDYRKGRDHKPLSGVNASEQ